MKPIWRRWQSARAFDRALEQHLRAAATVSPHPALWDRIEAQITGGQTRTPINDPAAAATVQVPRRHPQHNGRVRFSLAAAATLAVACAAAAFLPGMLMRPTLTFASVMKTAAQASTLSFVAFTYREGAYDQSAPAQGEESVRHRQWVRFTPDPVSVAEREDPSGRVVRYVTTESGGYVMDTHSGRSQWYRRYDPANSRIALGQTLTRLRNLAFLGSGTSPAQLDQESPPWTEWKQEPVRSRNQVVFRRTLDYPFPRQESRHFEQTLTADADSGRVVQFVERRTNSNVPGELVTVFDQFRYDAPIPESLMQVPQAVQDAPLRTKVRVNSVQGE
jgi:hypothetical protein